MKNENITTGKNLLISNSFPMVDDLEGPEVDKKVVIYNNLNVYKNMLPDFKEHMELLKESQIFKEKNYYFKPWEDWYGFGDMMNIPLDPLKDNLIAEKSNYKDNQIKFIKALRNALYKCTKDYIDQWDFKLPNWVGNGLSICKYKPTEHASPYAMTYHTDFRPTEADAPGKKFGLTCTIYINDDYSGGGLSFLHEETGDVINYKPNAGDVVVFPSGVPYWHAVDRVDNSEKYLVRCFWSYFFEGKKEWFENQKKYGKDVWEKMETERMLQANARGENHKYLVAPGEDNKKIAFASPFFAKKIIKIQ